MCAIATKYRSDDANNLNSPYQLDIVMQTIILFTGALFRTTFTDPGIIPRASHDEAAYIEKQIGELIL